MFLIEVLILLICGILRINLATNVIEIAPQYSQTYITLTCTAKETNATQFMIHLTCPFITTGFCFSNCKPSCIFDKNHVCIRNPQVHMISDCELDQSNSNQISTTYRIKTALINQTGDWRCSFKNYKSNSIFLAKYEFPTTLSSTTVSTSTSQIQTDAILVKQQQETVNTFETKNKFTPTIKSEKPFTQTEDSAQNFIIQHLTRLELVLALIVMLGFSLLLNLSFLIRCVLLKSVIDNYHRDIQNNSCVLGCLCIERHTKQKNYSRSFNLSNQVGAIYDDLSAVSNSSARMKLRSNHSSDMDEETKLTNFIPNGSCHINSMGVGSVSTSLPRRYTSPGHATYFHPGLGNYVIVSGPIANQDQYTMGTAPPSYTLQMVSPIPSAPGSISGGPAANISVQSANSDDIFDSDNSQTTNSAPNQSSKMNIHHVDLMDPNQLLDLSKVTLVPVNGFNQTHHPIINNQNNFNRSNGLVPLHPWPTEKVPHQTSSSVISLPQYSVTENGSFVQGIHRLNDSVLMNSISVTPTESTS